MRLYKRLSLTCPDQASMPQCQSFCELGLRGHLWACPVGISDKSAYFLTLLLIPHGFRLCRSLQNLQCACQRRQTRPYQDVVVQAQLSEDLLLYLADLWQKVLALSLCAHNKHFHLAKLVDSVQPFAGSTCTQGLWLVPSTTYQLCLTVAAFACLVVKCSLLIVLCLYPSANPGEISLKWSAKVGETVLCNQTKSSLFSIAPL